jgi:hypothetical protein
MVNVIRIHSNMLALPYSVVRSCGNSDKKHEQDTNQNLRGNFAKISASSQQQHPDHENLLLAKVATQFLKSRHKPIITLWFCLQEQECT